MNDIGCIYYLRRKHLVRILFFRRLDFLEPPEMEWRRPIAALVAKKSPMRRVFSCSRKLPTSFSHLAVPFQNRL